MCSFPIRVAIALILGCLAVRSAFAAPEFRLGISGDAAGDDGFVIESIAPRSAMRAIRDEQGEIQSAEPGDRVLTINQQPFSPELLLTMQQDLLKTSGLADVTLRDARTGNVFDYTAVLRRADLDPTLGKDFRRIVKEDFANVKRRTIEVTKTPAGWIGVNLDSSFAPLDAAKAAPLTILAECQAGIDRILVAAKEMRFDEMISAGTVRRAEAILVNAYAAVSLDPDSELSASIAANAQSAVINEFRSSFNQFAIEHGKTWREEQRYGLEGFKFRPVTDPKDMTVEVIESATVKLILLRKPATPPADIDQLSGWTPLPVSNASVYGRFYYRIREPLTGALRFGYRQDKRKVITSAPPNGEILFP